MTNWHGKSEHRMHGRCLTHTCAVRLGRTTPNRRARHQACGMWPVPGSRFLSSRCLSWAGLQSSLKARLIIGPGGQGPDGTCICVDGVNVDGVDNVNVIGPAGGGIRGGVAGQGMEAWPVKARVSGNVSVRAAPAPKAIQNQTANDSHPCSKHGSSGCSGTVVWIPTRR